MHRTLSIYDKESIIDATHDAFQQVAHFVAEIDEEDFFAARGEKWSIAENFEHLIRAAEPVAKVFLIPGIGLKYYFGKPNRPSRTYAGLVQRYEERLSAGGQASGRYVPQIKNPHKKAMLDRWTTIEHKLTKRIQKWDDKKLDNYIVPHPLLGKILIREALFFTVFHTFHHLKAMKKHKII